ncbi:hypothetical protein CROQUDRAFT_96739 [Cronartium quercuum f. sp. fusiforme G11]|uniref:Uncharacterized protein n=1 Tax=Cronartium quercuum f. sp. fusiforme G11 TaxID=708437 RepID=A0A9P6NG88_9BASI|nr:hypothetical protein CROQUDRAFT_96739 [Cronartium quercuum f. sp. fusiforme G11]
MTPYHSAPFLRPPDAILVTQTPLYWVANTAMGSGHTAYNGMSGWSTGGLPYVPSVLNNDLPITELPSATDVQNRQPFGPNPSMNEVNHQKWVSMPILRKESTHDAGSCGQSSGKIESIGNMLEVGKHKTHRDMKPGGNSVSDPPAPFGKRQDIGLPSPSVDGNKKAWSGENVVERLTRTKPEKMYPKAETGIPEVHAPKPTEESKSQSTLTSISSSYPTIQEALSIVSGMQKKEIGSNTEEDTTKNQEIEGIRQDVRVLSPSVDGHKKAWTGENVVERLTQTQPEKMTSKAETGLPEVHALKPTAESKSQSTLTSISFSYPTIQEALSIVPGMQKKEIGSNIEENTKKNQDITGIVQIPSTINEEIPNPSVVIDSKENSFVQHLTPSVPYSIIKKVKQRKSKKKKKTKQGKMVDQVEAVISQPSSQEVHGVHSSVPHIESVNKDSPGFEVESKTQDGPEDQKDVKNMSDMVSHRIQSEIPLSRQSQATKNESEDKTLVMNKESPSENLGRSLKNMEETLLISSKQSRTPLKKDVQSSTNQDKKAESSGGHIFSLKEKETVDSRLPTESESGSQIPLEKVSPGESSNDVEKSTLSSISVFDQDSQKNKKNKKKKKKKNTKVSENLGHEAFEQLNTSLASSSNIGSKQPQDIQKAIHSLFHLYDGQSSLKLKDLSLYKATLKPTDLSDSAAKMMAQFEKNAKFCIHHVSSLLGEEESLNRMYSVHSQAGQYFTTLGWKNNMSNLSDKSKNGKQLKNQ